MSAFSTKFDPVFTYRVVFVCIKAIFHIGLKQRLMLYIFWSVSGISYNTKKYLRFFKVFRQDNKIFNRVISDIAVVLREITLTVSESIETGSPVESEIVRVVSPKYKGNNRDKTI